MVSSTHDLLRLKNSVETDIKKLQQVPQQFNSIAARIKSNEPNAASDFKNKVNQTRQLAQRAQQKVKNYSDNAHDRFVTNRAQKKQQTIELSKHLKDALEKIEASEKHVIATEKQAINEYNRSHQLVDFGDDNIGSNGTSFTPQQTQASIALSQEMATRQRDMEELERDAVNIHMIFTELNQMVYQHGEVTDRIENHIDEALLQVEDGNSQLQSASRWAVSMRQKKLCLTAFCLVTVVVIIFIIWISSRR